MNSQSYFPILIQKYSNQFLEQKLTYHVSNVISVFLGVVLISMLAQLSFQLPWTPVPITGQTFGVTLVALLWGWKRGSTVMLSYLVVGSLGAPVFAMGKSGLLFGPTFGYLIGMLLASAVVGKLADLGATKRFWTSLLSAYLGSIVVFGCGLLVLSRFVPTETLLVAGLWPFLIGDSIKNLIAALTAWRIRRTIK